MSETLDSVNVHILDKDYLVACPAEERDELLASARYLDRKMREIRTSGKVVGTDRIAVIAALNITHELLQSNHHDDHQANSVSKRIQALQEKIETALNNNQQMEF